MERIIFYIEERKKKRKRVSNLWVGFLACLGRIKRREEEERGISIVTFTIPLSTREFTSIEERARERLLNRVFMKMDKIAVDKNYCIVVSDALSSYVYHSQVIDGNGFPLLYMEEMIQWVQNKHHLKAKDTSIILIETGNEKTRQFPSEEILWQIYDKKNKLGLVTNRGDFFEEQIDTIYKETGLLITIGGKLSYGNLILDFGLYDKRYVREIQKGGIYIDFTREQLKTKVFEAKRKDIIYYNHVHFTLDGKETDKKWIQALIWGISSEEMRQNLGYYKKDERVRLHNLDINRNNTI